MPSNLKVISEVEVPTNEVSVAPTRPRTEEPSKRSSEASRATAEVLAEIRLILNARAATLLAMMGALGLTAAAMIQQTTMALLIALSFDLAIFLPIALIAYTRRHGQ